MPTYSPEFKEAVMAQMLPRRQSIHEGISRVTGVCLTTARKCKQGAGRGGTARACRGPGAEGGITESRLRIVAAAAGLSDEELSAYARSQGLHVDQIKQYRRDCLQADVLISKLEQDHRLEQQALEEQLRAAQRDNKAKDKTIVELAALVALAKKINAI